MSFPVSAIQGELTGTLDFSITASTTAQCRAQGFSRDPSGRLVPFSRTFAHSAGDRTVENGTLVADMRHPILSFNIGAVPGTIERGQIYVNINVTAQNISIPVCRGYVYTENPLTLGEFVEPGPGGGEGFLSWVQVFHDRAGNAAALDFDLFATNALRKIYGLAWYYHCDGTAVSRSVLRPLLNGLGGTKPTGFTLTGGNATFWKPTNADLTLTANEEGAFIAYSMDGNPGRSVSLDNGTDSTTSAASEPSPFPLWVTELDTDTILRFRAITNGAAGDTHSAYVLMEEWLKQ